MIHGETFHFEANKYRESDIVEAEEYNQWENTVKGPVALCEFPINLKFGENVIRQVHARTHFP